MSVDSLLKLAHGYNTTLTVFLAALLMCSINEERPLKKRKLPVVLSIPVDLRHFFKSSTSRNFFFAMKVAYDFGRKEYDLTDVIATVGNILADNLTTEYLTDRLDKLIALERKPFIRLIPLPVKDLLLRIIAKIKSIICAASSLIFLSAIFIFHGESIKAELDKRMHI